MVFSRWLRAAYPPSRTVGILAVSTFITTSGSGLYVVAGALFFTRAMRLPVGQVALGLSAAGFVGLAASLVVGQLADLAGARKTCIAAGIFWGLARASLVFAQSFPVFIAVVCLNAIAERGVTVALAALVGDLDERVERTRIRAYLRSVTNVGLTIGTLVGGLAIQADTRFAYLLVMVGNGAAFFVGALLLMRVPRRPQSTSARKPPMTLAIRDRPYLLVTALLGFMSLHFDVLTFAIPLWIAGHTQAPRGIISVLIAINTALVVLLQVRASRGTEKADHAAIVLRRAGLALLVSCTAIGLVSGLPPVAAVAILIVSICVHTYGELSHSAANFGLSYELAVEGAHGQYQGVNQLGRGFAKAVAPLLLGLLCLQWGTPGWVLLGALLASAGMTAPWLVAWAMRQAQARDAALPGLM